MTGRRGLSLFALQSASHPRIMPQHPPGELTSGTSGRQPSGCPTSGSIFVAKFHQLGVILGSFVGIFSGLNPHLSLQFVVAELGARTGG